MTKRKMLNTIYERIANKEPTFGCKVRIEGLSNTSIIGHTGNIVNEEGFIVGKEYSIVELIEDPVIISTIDEIDMEIIGHPVMFGDMVDYIEKELNVRNKLPYVIDVLKFWTNKRKPIEEQTEECIKHIYELIK